MAIVTGGSRGIGRASAETLGARGLAVVIGYAGNQAAADAAVQTITGAGGQAVAVRADVADEVAVSGLFDQAEQLEFTFRGEASSVTAGKTVNIPANAPHFFRNVSDATVRMLCMCTPAGQEEFFAAVGDPVPSRTAAAPEVLDEDARAQRLQQLKELAPRYRTELVPP